METYEITITKKVTAYNQLHAEHIAKTMLTTIDEETKVDVQKDYLPFEV